MSVPEEEIIKRKLLIEGSGGSDEKKIHGLVKMFVKWCNSEVSAEESEATFQSLTDTLMHCELSCCKFQQVFNISKQEQENYEKLHLRIKDEIGKAERSIVGSKLELENALVVRRYKEEYDALAKIIDQHPERQQLLEEFKEVQEELLKAEQLEKHYDAKLNERKRQFHVLVTTLHQLQAFVNAEDTDLNNNGGTQHEEMDQT